MMICKANLGTCPCRAQSAVVFQAYGAACRSISGTIDPDVPLSYSQVFTAGEALCAAEVFVLRVDHSEFLVTWRLQFSHACTRPLSRRNAMNDFAQCIAVVVLKRSIDCKHLLCSTT